MWDDLIITTEFVFIVMDEHATHCTTVAHDAFLDVFKGLNNNALTLYGIEE